MISLLFIGNRPSSRTDTAWEGGREGGRGEGEMDDALALLCCRRCGALLDLPSRLNQPVSCRMCNYAVSPDGKKPSWNSSERASERMDGDRIKPSMVSRLDSFSVAVAGSRFFHSTHQAMWYTSLRCDKYDRCMVSLSLSPQISVELHSDLNAARRSFCESSISSLWWKTLRTKRNVAMPRLEIRHTHTHTYIYIFSVFVSLFGRVGLGRSHFTRAPKHEKWPSLTAGGRELSQVRASWNGVLHNAAQICGRGNDCLLWM